MIFLIFGLYLKTNNVYLDNYFDHGYLLNKIFNENIDYNFNKKKLILINIYLYIKNFLINIK